MTSIIYASLCIVKRLAKMICKLLTWWLPKSELISNKRISKMVASVNFTLSQQGSLVWRTLERFGDFSKISYYMSGTRNALLTCQFIVPLFNFNCFLACESLLVWYSLACAYAHEFSYI